ncbi:MAG: hypothetical protein II568_06435 [Erysipelotrichaceae bacterium]|nr:hypothetical protein [Erysipelotrichaceae bacterium]
MMKEKRQSKITIIVIILCLILLALSGLSLVLSLRSMKLSEQCCQMKVSETQSDYVNPLDQQQDEETYTELMGFGCLDVDTNSPFIYLINPSDNEVYLSFDVLYEGRSLYKSDLIAPGKMEQFDICSVLDAGKHTLTYSISSYDLNDKKVLWAGVQQNQDVSIRK